ncbi:MAG: sulfatase-like hydrolase/transferase [Verrucomicrobiota bacterium]
MNYFFFFFFLLSFIFSSSGDFAYGKSKPNIVCILVDDLGFGDLACQGATDMKTPHIDRLGQEGMTLTNFYANCTVCSPSRAALLTGKYPDLVGVPGVVRQVPTNNWGNLSDDAVMMPTALKQAGYHSALVGKWHLGYEAPDTPMDRGFDTFRGFLGDMMDDYWTHLRGGINWMRRDRSEVKPEGHATDIFTDWALEYFDERKGEEEPFYLFLAYNAPHFPIQPPQEYLDRVLEREKGLSEKRAANVAFIEHLDACVGRVIDGLERRGMLEDTLVVFSSDNGGALRYEQRNLPLRGGKQDKYEGGIKVPAFAMWRGTIDAGSSNDNLMLLMDLYPTFCDAAGLDAGKQVDGVSVLPSLLGEEQTTDNRYVFWMRREGGKFNGLAYYAVRKGDLKVLQNTPFEGFQYFDLASDPYEERPLKVGDRKEFREMQRALMMHVQQSGQVPWQ